MAKVGGTIGMVSSRAAGQHCLGVGTTMTPHKPRRQPLQALANGVYIPHSFQRKPVALANGHHLPQSMLPPAFGLLSPQVHSQSPPQRMLPPAFVAARSGRVTGRDV